MRALISDAAGNLIRRRVNSAEELIAAVYASLVRILEERELIRFGPFDATFCRNATLADLDEDKISRFLVLARRGRNFPLPGDTPPHEVLVHLNLLDKGRPTNGALLLFGKQPQRFLITSEVKCAHFHGYEVEKPIPSYQVYKGTVFDLVDQAKDFVLSKIDLWVGTRAESTQAPTKYEIPQEVVAEAIVNNESGIPKATAIRILKVLRDNDFFMILEEQVGSKPAVLGYQALLAITEGWEDSRIGSPNQQLTF
jgi:hypothetical protein